MTETDGYYPDTAINASTGFTAYSTATQADWENQMRSGWLRRVNPLQGFIDAAVNAINQIPVIGPRIAQAIIGVESVVEDLAPWFIDLRYLLGDPTGMGTGSPTPGPIESIPLLGGIVTYLEGVPLIGPLVQAITGVADQGIEFLGTFSSDLRSLLGNPLGLGTGAPVVDTDLTHIPLLGPVISWIQTYLINPIMGGTTHTLADLGSTIYSGIATANSAAAQWVSAIASAGTGNAAGLGTALAGAVTNVATALANAQAAADNIIKGLTGNTATGNSFASIATQMQSSLAGLLPSIQHNFDGTVTALTGGGITFNGDGTATFAPAANPVQTLISQADGTFTTAAQVIQQAAAAAVTQAGSNLTAAAVNIQSFLNGFFGGSTGQVATAVTPAQAAAAAAGTASTLGGHSSALGVLNVNAPVSYGYGIVATGNINAIVALSGSLPGSFVDISGTPMGAHAAKYGTICGTDTETVTGTWASPPPAGGYYYLFLRMNTAGTSYLYYKFSGAPGSMGYQELGCVVAGVKTVFTTSTFSGVAGNGIPTVLSANGYSFNVTQNGVSLLPGGAAYSDAGHVSQLGALYRYGGYGTDEAALPGVISQFTLADAGPVAGPAAAYVATSESSTTASYVDLTTTTDSVTITVGPSGMALVVINAEAISNINGGRCMIGFAVSGANTQAASDGLAAWVRSSSAGFQNQAIAMFFLSGFAAGSTTFKMKYKTADGGTCTYAERRITAIPL